tara:strand:+ start:1059 stop:2288 length:1230 start_codon:yes stop_codon:yes gene_type:complete
MGINDSSLQTFPFKESRESKINLQPALHQFSTRSIKDPPSMSILNDDEISALVIERMIFHVVKPESTDPTYLAEVQPPQCADFFSERVKETLKGSSYVFVPGSGIPDLLRKTLKGSDATDQFVKVSKDLAARFKDKVKQDKRLAPGVLMLFLLRTSNGEQICAVIKYEYQQVVASSYLKDEQGSPRLDPDGNPIPDLQSLVETFTQDRKSMQKSAVIRFGQSAEEDQIVVIDHASGRYRDASQHFANFLDIKRAMEPSEMTTRLADAAFHAIKSHKDEVPAEIAKAPKRHVRQAMARLDGFDHEKPEEFLGSIVQGLSPDAKILTTFRSRLSSCGLASEAFAFEGTSLPPAEYRRVITNEGITVLFNKNHEKDDKVQVQNTDNGGVTITINATGLERDDELEKMPRLSD